MSKARIRIRRNSTCYINKRSPQYLRGYIQGCTDTRKKMAEETPKEDRYIRVEDVSDIIRDKRVDVVFRILGNDEYEFRIPGLPILSPTKFDMSKSDELTVSIPVTIEYSA